MFNVSIRAFSMPSPVTVNNDNMMFKHTAISQKKKLIDLLVPW